MLDLVKEEIRTIYFDPRKKAVGGNTRSCYQARNRVTIINFLFGRYNFKHLRITLTSHGHLTLNHFK
ncbi:hypothetical protein BZY50_19080 [Enterobacter hormaechei]|nr:hypothetical protein BZY50_19080 [Enterobacter hormaechei]